MWRNSRFWLALATLMAALVVPTGVAAASSSCGTYSFGFTGTRLINDGISNDAGPFSIELPAGTYDVTVLFSDHHDQQPDPHQPNEQFHVRLDSGYLSPPSVDLPDDSNAGGHTFAGQQIAAASQISVHHLGVGGVNSVNVDCVGFTPSAAQAAAKPDQDIGDPASIEKPPAPELDPAPAQPVQVKPNAPEPVQPETPAAVAKPEPEVLGAVEEPPAVLALTGPNQTLVLINIALMAIGLGVLIEYSARRRPARRD